MDIRYSQGRSEDFGPPAFYVTDWHFTNAIKQNQLASIGRQRGVPKVNAPV